MGRTCLKSGVGNGHENDDKARVWKAEKKERGTKAERRERGNRPGTDSGPADSYMDLSIPNMKKQKIILDAVSGMDAHNGNGTPVSYLFCLAGMKFKEAVSFGKDQ